MEKKVGFLNAEGPPVPIPNTEVKLCSADNTSLETVREDRSKPTPRIAERKGSANLRKKDDSRNCHGGVAQLGEHLLCKQGVMGSSPIISTKRSGDGRAPDNHIGS